MFLDSGTCFRFWEVFRATVTAGFDYTTPRPALSKHFQLDLQKRHDSLCFISFRKMVRNVF